MAVEYVFPCFRNKTPAIAGGFYAASNDPQLINRWRWQYPLTGAPTGPVNDFDVLDIDRGGEDWLMNYECSHGPLSTRIVGTQSGGLHIYFQHHAGMKCSAGLLAPNVINRRLRHSLGSSGLPGVIERANWAVARQDARVVA